MLSDAAQGRTVTRRQHRFSHVRPLLVGVAAAALILTPAGASGKPVAERTPPARAAKALGSASETSSFPLPALFSDDLARPKKLFVGIVASPAAPLSGSYTMHCFAPFKSRNVEYPVAAAGVYSLLPVLPWARECYISALVGFADLDQAGTITLSAWGAQYPKKKRKKRKKRKRR